MKTNILPNNNDENHKNRNANIELKLKRLKKLKEVQVLIDKLGFEDPLNADEFVKYNKFEIACEMISDEEISIAGFPILSHKFADYFLILSYNINIVLYFFLKNSTY